MNFKKVFSCSTLIALVLSGASACANTLATAPNGGYWLSDGTPQNGAPNIGTVTGNSEDKVIASLPASSGKTGFWVVTRSGKVYAFGDATLVCGPHQGDSLTTCSGYPKRDGAGIFSVSAKADGSGFWVLDAKGHVWTAGAGVVSYGDVTKHIPPGSLIPQPTEIRATPSGKGYYIFFSDGGVYCFGDATPFGSTGGHSKKIYAAELALDASGSVNGYWMLDTDGGVQWFGKAPNLFGYPSRRGYSCDGLSARADGRTYGIYCHGWDVPSSLREGLVLAQTRIVAYTQNVAATVHNNSKDAGDLLVGGALDEKTDSNQWVIFPLDGNWQLRNGSIVQLKNVGSGMCMNVSGSSYHEMIQYPCQSSNSNVLNDRWRLEKYSFQTGWSLRPLSEPDWALTAGTNLGDELMLRQSQLVGQSWSLPDVPDVQTPPELNARVNRSPSSRRSGSCE